MTRSEARRTSGSSGTALTPHEERLKAAVHRLFDKTDAISACSKRVYASQLWSVLRMFGRDADLATDVLGADPADVWARIEDATRGKSPYTWQGKASAVAAALRHADQSELPPGMRGERGADARRSAQAAWAAILSARIKPSIDRRVGDNRPSDRQRASVVTLQEMHRKLVESERGSDERLLLAMYSLMPPQRSDFGRARVLRVTVPRGCASGAEGGGGPRCGPPCDPAELERAVAGAAAVGGNAVVLAYLADGRGGREPSAFAGFVVMREYKTAKTFGPRVLPIGAALVREIEAAVDDPRRTGPGREYLFVSPRTGEPFPNDEAFTQFLHRKMEKAFPGKRVGVTMMRHAAASALPLADMTDAQVDHAAWMFGHTAGQLRAYRHLPQGRVPKRFESVFEISS